MRSTTIVVMVVALAGAPGCFKRPFPTGAAPMEPVPQDAALSAKRSNDLLEWNRRTLAGAYEKVGKQDPRWDAKAKEALEKAARLFSRQVDPMVSFEEVVAAAKEAEDAGCDDPMVLYFVRRVPRDEASESREDAEKRYKEMAEALRASKYPAIRRAVGLRLAGFLLLDLKSGDETTQKIRQKYFDESLALLPGDDLGDDRGRNWEDTWYGILRELLAGYRTMGLDAVEAYERVDAALAKTPELEALRLKFRGRFWLDYGWEARAKAFAPLVPRGGFETLEERLAAAREALEKSYEIQPDAEVANILMAIDKSVDGDREVMEMWFNRAMKLDPDNRDICWAKLDWLDPKWYGTWDEAIAFGRACKATGNWRTGITLLAGDAHYRFACTRGLSDIARYLSQPQVWADIGPSYDEYLAHYPDDNQAMSKYALLAAWAGRNEQAHKLFQELGDRLTVWNGFPHQPLENLKSVRDKVAQAVK